jgi:chromosome partitioning protein
MINWIGDAFDDTPAWEVRERAAIQRVLSNGASIFVEEPDCDQIEVFEQMAANLDEQFDFREVII